MSFCTNTNGIDAPTDMPQDHPLDLIRHAHGVHNDAFLDIEPGNENAAATCVRLLDFNVNGDLIFDPVLSIRGMGECEDFRKNNIATRTDHRFEKAIIAVSPFKRNIMSALLMFGEQLSKQDEQDRWIVVDPALQERNNAPCNIGSETRELRAAFEGWVDDLEGSSAADVDEIKTKDLIQAWRESSNSNLGTEPLKEIWVQRGWLTREQVDNAKPDERGFSSLGDAVVVREFRRRAAKHPGLSKVKLLIVGDDITKQDWIDKQDMNYHRPPKRCFAPFPDLFIQSLSQARENMGTRWKQYTSQWTEKEGFRGWDGRTGVVGIIHSGLTAALVRQWGSFRLPKNNQVLRDEYQVTSHDVLGDLKKLQVGDRYKVPRLSERPEVYGFWTYSRQDSCKLEWINGKLELTSDDGWQVIEHDKSRGDRKDKHFEVHNRKIQWFTDKEDQLWEKYALTVLMVSGYVFQAYLREQIASEDNAVYVEFGGLNSDETKWRFYMGDKEIPYTLGTQSEEVLENLKGWRN